VIGQEAASESVHTDTRAVRCEQCGEAIDVGRRRRIKTRRFCRDTCRADWHREQKRRQLERLERAAGEVAAVIAEMKRP
jgi:RNA polymerase-binding transcription factor DksA